MSLSIPMIGRLKLLNSQGEGGVGNTLIQDAQNYLTNNAVFSVTFFKKWVVSISLLNLVVMKNEAIIGEKVNKNYNLFRIHILIKFMK